METKYDESAKKLGLPIEDILKVVADVEARIGTDDMARVRHLLALGWDVCAKIIGDSVIPHEYLAQDGCEQEEISDVILACRASMLETARVLRNGGDFAE